MHWRKSSARYLLCAFVCLAAPAAAGAAAEPEIPAQVALFDSDHLKNIHSPVRLNYSFARHGNPSQVYQDSVVADVRVVHPDGGKDVWIHFLSGQRQMPATPVMDFHGNPLLMYFLEHDVLEMRQETGIPAAYFRTRVRRAIVYGARISKVAVPLDGKTLPATEIDITPFGTDPGLANLPSVAGKTYHFILCDQVPGTIYQIGSRMPAAGNNPVVDESMTYVGEAR